MPLQKQNVSISFARGADTKTDPKQVIQGKLLALENGVLTTPLEIRKRNGYAAFGTSIEGSSSTISAGAALATYQDELALFSGSNLYSYAASTTKWTNKGSGVSLELSKQSVVRNSYQQTTPDCAYHTSGLQLFTWEDSRGGSRYSIVDSSTGQLIVADAQILSTAATPKPFAFGNYFIILYFDTSNNHLSFKTVSVVTPSVLSSSTDISTNMNVSNHNWDAAIIGARLFVAYNNSDVGNGISLKYINTFLTISSALDVTTESASVCISVVGDQALQQVWVAYYNGTAVKYFISDYNLSSTAVRAATVIETVSNVRNVCGSASNGSGTFWYEVSAGATYNYLIRTNTANSAGTVGTASVFIRSLGLAGKPFTYNSNTYIPAAFQSTLQPTYFLLDSNAKVAAKIAPGNGGGLTAKSVLPESVLTTAGNYLLAYLEKDQLTTVSGNVYTQTGVSAATFNFTSQNAYLRAEFANNLHVTGGVLTMYDGASLVEHGFHLFPENVTASAAGSGGSLSAGTYQYSVCYEWMDNQGQVHRSAPLVGLSVTTVSSDKVTLTIPTLRVTRKTGTRTPVTIVVYRTQVNQTTFYQISSITSPLLNDPTADTVSYQDSAADTTLPGNPLLYTNGSVLENIAAPAVSLIGTYKDRVVIVPSEDRLSYQISKEVVPGVPVEFNDALTKRINQKGGEITAHAEMDDKLILFKQSYIFYTWGEGPDATGAGDDIPDAQLVTSAYTGCTNHRSVVVTPAGLLRQTGEGIYLLDRSLRDLYVGAAVEAYNSDTVVSAAVIPNTTQVRFLLSSGVALVYDYYMTDEQGIGQWSVFTNHQGVDAVVFQNKFTYLKSSGLVLQETPGAYSDNGNFIKLKLKMSWLSFAGLQGFQRVREFLILGNYASPHQLRVQIAHDFKPLAIDQQLYIDAGAILETPAWGEDANWGSADVWGGDYPLYQFRVMLEQQKCQSIQVSLEDTQATNIGEGFSISALGFRVAGKQGLNKMPANRTFG